MRESIEKAIAGASFSIDESAALMHAILSDEVPLAQVAAVLTALRIHGVSLDMLDGFAGALLDMATRTDLGDVIDVCGTGGDGKGSFNISTTVAFVLAGCGFRVAKHGNSAVSSSCGSSNVLEALGIELTADVDRLQRALDKTGICFIHAPLFHPAMKRVAGLRRELGFRTVFNALGPLVNPARPLFQYSGVYDLELQRLYGYVLQRRGGKFAVVHSLDGYDEVSLTGSVRVVAHSGTSEYGAKDFGVTGVSPQDLKAPTTVAESASLVTDIVEGRGSPIQTEVVVANAALAMYYAQGTRSLAEYQEIARESIRTGKALEALQGSRRV